jgi:hypothetical protein
MSRLEWLMFSLMVAVMLSFVVAIIACAITGGDC